MVNVRLHVLSNDYTLQCCTLYQEEENDKLVDSDNFECLVMLYNIGLSVWDTLWMSGTHTHTQLQLLFKPFIQNRNKDYINLTWIF